MVEYWNGRVVDMLEQWSGRMVEQYRIVKQ